MKRKSILILGAGYLQSFVISKAKDLGYYVIAVDKSPDSVGFNYSDEYQVLDIINQEACLEFARERQIDGVMTAATDYGVLSSSFIASKMGLPGLNYQVAIDVKDKYVVRRILHENDIDDIRQFYVVEFESELRSLNRLIKFPVIVKPIDGSGSKAITRVNSKEELKNACLEAIEASVNGKALVEDFIEGEEYGIESFVHHGVIQVLGIMQKHMTSPPNYAELGHSIPSGLVIEERIVKMVKAAIRSLGINFGAVNMDVLVTKDNRISIIDVGARMGGNLIGSHIIPYSVGFDYMGTLIRSSLGAPVCYPSLVSKKAVATKILALQPGKIDRLPDFTEIEHQCNVKIFHNLKEGQIIRPYSNNLDGCGYVFAIGESKQICLRRAADAKRLVDSGIKRAN